MQSPKVYLASGPELVAPDQPLSASLYLELGLWKAMRRRWFPAVIVAGAVFIAVFGYVNAQPPRYQSEMLILLDRQPALPVVDARQPVSINRDFSTEVQILRSRPLVEQAMRRLPEPFQNISIEKVVIPNLKIRQISNADVLSVVYVDVDPERVKAVLDALGSTYVDYSLESRRSKASNAIAFIEEQLPGARAALEQSASAIRQFRETHRIVDPDSFGQSLVETREALAEQIRQNQIAINQTQQREQVLLGQLGQEPDVSLQRVTLNQDSGYQTLVAQLQQAELDLALERIRFREEYPKIQELQARRDRILALLQQRIEQVLGSDPAVNPSSGQANLPLPIVRDSLIGEPNSQAGSTSSGSTINSTLNPAGIPASPIPLQQTLAEQVMRARVELAVLNAQLASLRQVEAEINRELERIPQLQQTYTELQRQNAVASELVNTFLSRLQELRITEAQEVSPWRVLQPSGIPKTPIFPNWRHSVAFGLLAGGILGIATALLLERMDQRIRGVEEAKAFTGLTMLGAVPKVNLESLMVGEEQRRNDKQMLFTEAFRSAALNLGYLGGSEEMRTLCFTSAVAGEGKSTVTFHLAKALAELGHKVLLVDADMRKPTQHKLIQETNAIGLSTVLVGETTWQNALHSVIPDRFHLLSSGPMPSNPVALLSSSSMTRLLREWRQAYRYILIDTPRIVGIADAQSVANQVDGVVLVLGPERAGRPSVAWALELLRAGQVHLVGMIINLLDARHDGYAYYQYSYREAEMN